MTKKVTIVGLGSSNEDHLTMGVYKRLLKSKHIYLRTGHHPVASFLENEGIRFETFDYLYDTLTEYEQVYMKIAMFILERTEEGKEDLIYAVPGHPMVAEKSVKFLLEKAPKEEVEVEIVGGESFLDTFFSSFHIDPIEGFVFLNGETLKREDLTPSKNTVIGQVYNQFVASDLKLTLMEIYPDEIEVWVAKNLGMEDEEIKRLPLYQLDHNSDDFHHLSSVYIPRVKDGEVFQRSFPKLIEVVQILRSPNGCPWDREQTHQSIRKNLIEEAYELAETIDELDMDHMVEELGDVLLQVMLHSQIADEEGYFDIFDVILNLNQKLIRRHPHVFGDKSASEAEEALNHWEEIKRQEKEEKNITSSSVLDGIPKDLPAILKAYKLQKKAAKVKFDWTEVDSVYAKIYEEIDELKNADQNDQLGELGDVLFAVVNLARFLKIDPEEAIAKTNLKFKNRFHYIEKKLMENNISFQDATLELMEKYWEEAKRQ